MAFIQEPDPSRHGIIQILGEENPHHPPGVIFSQSEVVENNLALDGQLVDGEAERFFGDGLVDATDLEHDAAGLDDRDPCLGVALTGTMRVSAGFFVMACPGRS